MMRDSLIADSIIEQFSPSIVILHAGTINAIQALKKQDDALSFLSKS